MINQKIAQAAKEDAARWNVSWATKEVEHHIRTFEAGAAKYAELLSGGVSIKKYTAQDENFAEQTAWYPIWIPVLRDEENSLADIDDKLELCELSALHASQLEVQESQAQIAELKAENERLNNLLKDKAMAAKEVITGLLDKATERIDALESQLKEARGVAEKYADGYIFDEADEDTEQLDLNKSWRHTSGKLARAYLLKYPSEV